MSFATDCPRGHKTNPSLVFSTPHCIVLKLFPGFCFPVIKASGGSIKSS